MTSTDVLISTDADGTQHWERQLHADDFGIFTLNRHLDTEDYFSWDAIYGDYADSPNVVPLAAQGIVSSQAPNTFTYQASIDYYSAPDTDLPDGATAGDRLFRLKWRNPFHISRTDVFLTASLFTGVSSGLRPDDSDHSDLERIATDAPVTRLVADQDVEAAATDQITDATTTLDDDTWAAILAAGDTFGVRYTIYPSLFTAAQSARFNAEAAGVNSDPDDADYPGIMFVQQFTLPGTTPTSPVTAPRFHTARQVLDAHRQPSIIIGRRRFGARSFTG